MAYSLAAYRDILAAAQARGARFASLAEAPGSGTSTGVVYLRHDVDYSLQMAVELAKANAALGVSGTFFLLLRSQVYNLLSYDAIPYVQRLADLGQRLGFHMALPSGVPATAAGLAELVRADFDIVARHVPAVESVFAWHNTTPAILELGLDLDVPGLVSAYSRRLFKDIPYHSDTGMRYSVREWRAIAGSDAPAMQLLFHPELWVGGGDTVTGALARTWPYVIRERETEFRVNRSYGARFPDGMPTELLERLAADVARDGGGVDDGRTAEQ